jgi:exopolyphosphatase/guanosine-5'-triphosphate,3'-diphosphate pyrophosphatase
LLPALKALEPAGGAFVGVGGSATVLASMQLELREFNRERLEGFVLRHAEVTARTEQLWSLPLAQRQLLPGLPPKRADVILAGAAIYEAVMEVFGFETCRVSTRGLRYAALLEGA